MHHHHAKHKTASITFYSQREISGALERIISQPKCSHIFTICTRVSVSCVFFVLCRSLALSLYSPCIAILVHRRVRLVLSLLLIHLGRMVAAKESQAAATPKRCTREYEEKKKHNVRSHQQHQHELTHKNTMTQCGTYPSCTHLVYASFFSSRVRCIFFYFHNLELLFPFRQRARVRHPVHCTPLGDDDGNDSTAAATY